MQTKNLSRVSVVCTFAFPEGLAASTRIISYLKGLHQLGVRTDVFIYRPTEVYNKKSKYPPKGEFEGIQYIYPKTRTYSKYRLLRFLKRYYYYLITCINIWKENKKQKIDFLLISNDFLDILFTFTITAKLLKIKPIFITDEYPSPIRGQLKDKIPNWKSYLYKKILKHEDSLIFMTEKLNKFYNSELNKSYHILPTITDTSRFNIPIKKSTGQKYLCYMGNMELAKDNVDNIIVAFSKISDKYRDINFFLYGAPSQTDKQYLENVIEQNNLKERVFIKNRVNFEEVPQIVKNAYILVSSQPNTKRAEGGFPTKLGEYMAAGVPTLLTDVGEITQYVQDGVHVHIVPPENPLLYAEKLEFIINNYEHCKKIAENAKKYLAENFDYLAVAKKLKDFLETRL